MTRSRPIVGPPPITATLCPRCTESGSVFYAMAVRDGDVPSVPGPKTYALVLAGLGLLGLVARPRNA